MASLNQRRKRNQTTQRAGDDRRQAPPQTDKVPTKLNEVMAVIAPRSGTGAGSEPGLALSHLPPAPHSRLAG